MGSSLQRNLGQRTTTPGAAASDAFYTGDRSSKAIPSVTSSAARGSCLGGPPDISGQPCLPEPTEATQPQCPVPSHAEAGMLEHLVLIPDCKDLHAGHGGYSSSTRNAACVYEEVEFPICWGPHRAPTAEISTAEAPVGMSDHGVQPLEIYYQRMLGVDDQMWCHEAEEISESDGDGGMLVMKTSNTTLKLKACVPRIKNGTADPPLQGQHEGQNYPKPLLQHIPQIHLQAVTPPDSKLAPRVTQDAIITSRPPPAPASTASQQKPSPVALITSNRLPQNVGLATPEYTLVTQFSTPSTLPRLVHKEVREEERGFTPTLGSFTHWPGNPSLPSLTEKAKNRAQQRVSRVFTCRLRRNTSPNLGISETLLHALIPSPVPLGRGLTNPDPAAIKDIDYPVAEIGSAAQGLHAKTVIVRDFDCPPENYIHEHFTKAALRRRWELSQSYTQWPKLKTPNRDSQ